MKTGSNKRPILAYHAIFSAYGFWLPNDPRGSWSDFVWSWELFRYGPATKTDSRRSVAAAKHDHELRLKAKQTLKYPAVKFNGRQALAIAEGFKIAIVEARYNVHACAILPDHIHMVVKRCDRDIESVVQHLKSKATMQLNSEGIHPLQKFALRSGSAPTPWIKRCWKVFLHDENEIDRAIRYVENNPLKEGKRLQKWSFVTPYKPTS